MPSIQEFVLFKDSMWMGNIPELDFDQLVEFATDVYDHDIEGRQQSNRGGYQSHDVFPGEHKFKNHGEFNQLMSCMANAVETGVKSSYDKDVIITPGNSWVNINHPGDFNTMHSHPACVFSSVVYLTDNNRKHGILCYRYILYLFVQLFQGRSGVDSYCIWYFIGWYCQKRGYEWLIHHVSRTI